jgi:competence protein ComEC
VQKPLITLTLAYVAGLLLGSCFLYAPAFVSALIVLALLTAGLSSWSGLLSRRRFLILAVPCALGMAAYIYSSAWIPSDHYTRTFPDTTVKHEMTGMIASALERDPDRTGFIVELHRVDGTPVSGAIRMSVRRATAGIGYGDVIRFSGRFFEPGGFSNPAGFDYAAYLQAKGIQRTVSLKNESEIELLQRGVGLFRQIQDWRERIRLAFLASTTGPGSAILQAMTLGEEGGLTDDMRDSFMAAGVTHIISISGSHLGMVAILCFGLIRLVLRLLPERQYHRLTLVADPKKIAAWLTLPFLIFYTLLAGGQVATVRSLIMLIAALAAILLDRENALIHSLALAALLILVASPQAVFDISFQLSFLSVLAIGSVVMLWNELQVPAKSRFARFRNSALLLVLVSLSTTLATAPLVAHYFNQVSLVGVVSNMVIVPFAGFIVVPLGLFSGVLSLLTGTLPLPALNQLVADRFCDTVTFFSRLPVAQFHPPAPGLFSLLAAALFLGSGQVIVRSILLYRYQPLASSSRIPRIHVTIAAVSGLLLILSMTIFFMPRRTGTIQFPDVGQGDCALITLASGENILIDGGGTYDDRFDIGRRIVAPYLWNQGIHRIDLVVLSHPHPDHMNGLKYLVRSFNLGEFWTSGLDKDLPGYVELERMISDRGIPLRIVSAADPPVVINDAGLQLLHPAPGFRPRGRKAYAAENSRSLVVRIALEGKVFLFPGDIGEDAEKEMLLRGTDLRCDLIKVPHHGSNSSSSEPFLSRTRPAIGVVTVGSRNRYHHPSPEVIARYRAAGTQLFRTDSDGALFVTVDKGGLIVRSWRTRMLQRIEIANTGSWRRQEKQNWRALWLRAADA